MHDVLLTERSQEELQNYHDWWAENRSIEQANCWYTGFIQAMLTLENEPKRCPLAPENEIFPIEIRQLNFGLGQKPTHRAVYCVRPDTVVTTVRGSLCRNGATR